MFKREPSKAEKLIDKIFDDLENMPSFTKSVEDINTNLSKLVKRLDWLVLSLTVIFAFQLVSSFLIKPTFELKQDPKLSASSYKIIQK
jgi:hypothetical protein